MQAQLFGFVWELGRGITLSEFIAHLGTLKGKETPFAGYDRLLYVGERGDYFVGLFLKIKDQRKLPELKTVTGTYKVTVRSLDDDTSLLDFNFFIVHKRTHRGLYQHYWQSCSLNQFCIFCSQQYDGLREATIERELKPLGGEGALPAFKARVEATFQGSLTWQVMVRADKLEDLLKELKRIKFLEFDMAVIDDADSALRPLKPWAKKQRRVVRFVPTQEGLVQAIPNVLRTVGATRGKVGGVGADDKEKVFRLIENPDKFAEFEYDEIANETTLNLAQVEKSPFFDEMFNVIDGDPAIKAMFEEPAR